MTGSAAQWSKEVRQMAWPWAIVTGAGLLVLARPWFSSLPSIPGMSGMWTSLTAWMLPVGTFFGTAILAVLPMGSEFQYRTVAMHLAQPIDRAEIWRQKFIITVAAVAPAALLYCVAMLMDGGRPVALATAGWIVVTMFGAIPLTIVARSVIGGIVMTQAAGFWVMLSWSYFENHHQFPILGVWGLGVAIVAYAALMTWTGRRMMIRFQAADGMQAREDFVPGARLLPKAVTRWFECRPRQPIGNMIRREFRLTRILWLLIGVYLVAWVSLVVFHLLPRPSIGPGRFVPFAFTLILGLIIAVLAGTLSLGEEKTWGTHDWHMTLPVSMTTQWAVKLLFAVGTSVVFVVLIPLGIVMVGQWAGVPMDMGVGGDFAWVALLEAAGITFAAFWCSCLVKGTIQSTLWVFPVCISIGFASVAGGWVLEVIRTPLRNAIAAMVERLDPVRVGHAVGSLLYIIDFSQVMLLVVPPVVAIALIQSLRTFRAQVGANRLRVVRYALPLMLVTFLWGGVSVIFYVTLNEAWQQSRPIIKEADKAIGMVAAAEPGTAPRRITAEELAKTAPLSEPTRRWLRNATITIGPAPQLTKTGPGPYFPGQVKLFVNAAELKGRVPYSAVLRKADGRDCSMQFEIQHSPGEQHNVGFLDVICSR